MGLFIPAKLSMQKNFSLQKYGPQSFIFHHRSAAESCLIFSGRAVNPSLSKKLFLLLLFVDISNK